MKERVKSFFGGFGYVVLFFAVNIMVSLIGGIIISGIAGAQAGMNAVETGVAPSTEQMMADSLALIEKYTLHMTMVFQVMTVLCVGLICMMKKSKLRVEANITKIKKYSVLWIAVLGVGLAAFVSTFMTVFVPEDIMAAYNAVAEKSLGGPIVIQLISSVLLAPIMEEIVFRGMVLPRFQKAMPTPVAVFLSCVFFGLAHGQIVWIAYATVVGIVLSIIALKEKTITASILLHMVFNAIGFGIGYLPLEDWGVKLLCAISFVMVVVAFVMIFKKRTEEEQMVENVAA